MKKIILAVLAVLCGVALAVGLAQLKPLNSDASPNLYAFFLSLFGPPIPESALHDNPYDGYWIVGKHCDEIQERYGEFEYLSEEFPGIGRWCYRDSDGDGISYFEDAGGILCYRVFFDKNGYATSTEFFWQQPLGG